MECLKLYDKQEDGTMLLAELEHSLKALGEWQSHKWFPQLKLLFRFSSPGEKLSDDEVNEVFADCMDPEDDDGNIFYARKCHFQEFLYIILSILTPKMPKKKRKNSQ